MSPDLGIGLLQIKLVKMKSLGWTSIQYDQIPYQEGKFDTETHKQGECIGR